MQRLINWLAKEEPIEKICLIAARFLIIGLFYMGGMAALLGWIDVSVLPVFDNMIKLLEQYFLLDLIVLAAFEEVRFRLPLFFAVKILGRSVKVLVIAALLSIWFGWLHGGILHVFLQGVLGFIWCLLFLKCGGFQQKYLRAFIVTTTVHTIHNGILIIILRATYGGVTIF